MSDKWVTETYADAQYEWNDALNFPTIYANEVPWNEEEKSATWCLTSENGWIAVFFQGDDYISSEKCDSYADFRVLFENWLKG